MAIQALQIPSSNINNLVDQSQWSSLANLGNVYKQAQEDAAKQDALAKLGQGVDADTATLLHSGVPSLAQIGLNMQQNALTRSREDARNAVSDTHWSQQFAIQQAAAKREQEKYEDVQDKEAKARAAFLAGGQLSRKAHRPSFRHQDCRRRPLRRAPCRFHRTHRASLLFRSRRAKCHQAHRVSPLCRSQHRKRRLRRHRLTQANCRRPAL